MEKKKIDWHIPIVVTIMIVLIVTIIAPFVFLIYKSNQKDVEVGNIVEDTSVVWYSRS